MENVFEVSGKIFKMLELKESQTSDYKKRDILVECMYREHNNKQYSEIVKFKTDNKRTDDLSMYAEGDKVNIGFTLNGRMWSPPDENKEVNFTDLKVVWMQKVDPVVVTPQQSAQAQTSTVVDDMMDDGDLPF
jgi:secreted PhoX family phosphatase